MSRKSLVKYDLICNWLKNIIANNLTEWEMSFIDSIWIDEVSLTANQRIKLTEIYRKYRFNDKGFCDVNIGEYNYIHDFDK